MNGIIKQAVIAAALCGLSSQALAADLLVNDQPYQPTLKIGQSGNGNWYTLTYIEVLGVKQGSSYLVMSSTQLSNNLRNGRAVQFSSILMAHAEQRAYYHEPFDYSYLGEIAPWSTVNITPEMHHYGRSQMGIWQADQDYAAVYFVLGGFSASAKKGVRGKRLDVDNATLQVMQVN